MLRLRGRLSAGVTADSAEPEINMAPMIDMVFILLIFFLVTTTFVRETGVEVERPQAQTAVLREQAGLLVGITAAGQVFIDGRQVDMHSVRGLVERFLAETPEGGVVVVADKASPAGKVIAVLDQARMAGAEKVAVAARRPGP